MNNNQGTQRNNFGFTLIELLTVIAIMAILASIAVPGFNRWLPNYRLRMASRDMLSNFQLAKLEAVRRNIRCTVTFNQNIGGTTYSYVLYVDADEDLEYDTDATGDGIDNNGDGVIDEGGEAEEVIKMVLWADYEDDVLFDTDQGDGDGIDGDGLLDFPIVNGLPSISFRPNGIPADNANQPAIGTVFLKSTKGRTKNIGINAGGSVQIN